MLTSIHIPARRVPGLDVRGMNDKEGTEGVMAEEALSGELFSHLAEGALKACIAVSHVPLFFQVFNVSTRGREEGQRCRRLWLATPGMTLSRSTRRI